MNDYEMVTTKEVESVWGNANFGLDPDKLGIVKDTLLKLSSGYATGSTAMAIARDLKLLTKKNIITGRGQYCLYEFFGREKRITQRLSEAFKAGVNHGCNMCGYGNAEPDPNIFKKFMDDSK
ncbi:MAG: hypothetical protein DRH26_01365 [Deltaproteobacteria bacterium]|nr:MAG: hypothetical protein DRH26_01365 [Deltaproteobacteria bacterium]